MVDNASLNRIRAFYAAYFAAMGLVLPYFPVYLDARGLDAAAIGVMTGLVALAKVIAPPWIGHRLDQHPAEVTHRFIILASWCAAIFAIAIGWSFNIWLLAGIVLLFGIFWAAVLPLTDGLSISIAEHADSDYGQLRVWGSIGFVIASLAGGAWLAGRHIDLFPLLLGLLMVMLALVSRGFPTLESHAEQDRGGSPFPDIFYLLLALGFMMQLSHGAYYGFFSLYLADAGYSGWQIGIYWVIGVAAEIILMWRWTRQIQSLSPRLIFSICLALAAIRWLGMAITDEPVTLALLQLLHAASFAAFHVAAIAWVRRLAPTGRHAAAQGLFSATGFGLGSTVGIMAAGVIVEAFGYATAFYLCAGVALLGILPALWLKRAYP